MPLAILSLEVGYQFRTHVIMLVEITGIYFRPSLVAFLIQGVILLVDDNSTT